MSDEELEPANEIETEEPQSGNRASTVNELDNVRILEALLFASDEQLTAAKLKTILPGSPDARLVRKMVDKINVQLQKERHPFEIVEIGGGYQFRTVSYYHPWVRQIFKDKAAKKLSIQALECLAIIGYKQPISKAEIEIIRGVVSDGAMKTLLEKRLVTISGRSDKPGRPLLYSTTNEFLTYFGLNKISDLPQIEEFEAIAREKMEELSIQELQTEEKVLTDEEAQIAGENQPAALVKAPEDTAIFEVATEKPEEKNEPAKDSSPTPVNASADAGESTDSMDVSLSSVIAKKSSTADVQSNPGIDQGTTEKEVDSGDEAEFLVKE